MTGTGTGRGRPLRYEGYGSWGWLEPGRDLRAFNLASAIGGNTLRVLGDAW